MRRDKNHQRMPQTPLLGTVVCFPRCPLQDCSVHSLIVGEPWLLLPHSCVSLQELLLSKWAILFVTIQSIWPNVYWGQLTFQNWLIKEYKSLPSCLILGQLPRPSAPNGAAAVQLLLHLLSHTSQTFLQVLFLRAHPNKPHLYKNLFQSPFQGNLI